MCLLELETAQQMCLLVGWGGGGGGWGLFVGWLINVSATYECISGTGRGIGGGGGGNHSLECVQLLKQIS